ncbi:MAG: hypothetical protein KBA31_09885 [Alphaproteobacteria bacterium]|nr:hypothetical protein [Alphaproteobacteria bacterium]
MSLSDLAALGSFFSGLGGLGVLVSLVFLFVQLRQIGAQVKQTEKNQRALISQAALAGTRDIIRAFAEPHAAALMSRVVAGERDFTAAELYQLSMMLRQSLIGMQDALFQHRESLIDEGTLENAFRANRSTLAQPVFRALWLQSRETYAPEVASRVDKLIADRSVAKPVDAVARFQVNLGKLTTGEKGPLIKSEETVVERLA